MQTLTKSDGSFIFCPLPSESFEVVADASVPTQTGTIGYNATITFGVPSGTAMGKIPIVAETGVNTSPATITGQITTTTGMAPTQADISLAAFQLSNGVLVTIPPLASSAPDVTTQSVATCPPNTDCVGYTLIVPSSNPSVGIFSVNPATSYSIPAGPPISYSINAQAFNISSSLNPGAPDCSPSSLTAQITVTPGGLINQNFPFTGCQ